MKKNFCFDTEFNKINVSVESPWMEAQPGEGELEIENQGRLRFSESFSQETGAIGQQAPWNGEQRPKLKELSAGCARYSDSTPHLFSLHQELLESQIQELRQTQEQLRKLYALQINELKREKA